MYFMYVDESGDTGVTNSPTKYFALSSLIVHELRWQACLDRLIAFRRRMRDKFGLKMSEEIHASAMISKPGALSRIPKNDRLTILRGFAEEIASLPDVSSINVVVKKLSTDTSQTVFDKGWITLIQRFENTLSHRNFPGPSNPDERGLIICDATDIRLNRLVRRMRRYNPVPNQPHFGHGYRNLQLKAIVEDPMHRDSKVTYFIQAADTIAYLLYQRGQPNKYMKKTGGKAYFLKLKPILCLHASLTHPLGIVLRLR
jgi:hypothetical protein